MDDMSSWLSDFREMNPVLTEETESVKKKASTLMLADELHAMDFRDMDFYTNLSDTHKKEISMWLLMRFMSNSSKYADHHLLMVNDIVNEHFSAMSKHPELQWKLLAMCGTDSKQYHAFIPPGKAGTKNKAEQALLDIYPLIKDDDIELLLKINSKEELVELFKEYGLDNATIKDIVKAPASKGK